MIPLDASDTIAAIASPPGPAPRGLVRLSGPDAWAIALELFRFRDETDQDHASAPSRPTMWPGQLELDGLRMPAAVSLWPGNRTYTGQPMAEVHTVGSPPLLNQVLSTLLARGARLAEPGEFTMRAFLSGRIDLTRAEAVLAVIDSRSPEQLDTALRQLAGGLSGPIDRLRDRMLDTLAHLEAGLDFVDEADVDPIGRQALADELGQAADEVAALADRLRGRDRPASAPRVVLIGPPNAGKSRLFNALTGEEHALVSPIAGTTRDYLLAPCDCDGLTIDLIDTAGEESAGDPIASAAQTLRAAQAAGADLLLDCRSVDTPLLDSPATDRPSLIVLTKADRGIDTPLDFNSLILTSAETGQGLDHLRQSIALALRARFAEDDPTALTSARCRDGLRRASEALRNAASTIRMGGGDELVAIDLRDVVEELGRVLGEQIDDAILDRIFQRFCIGK